MQAYLTPVEGYGNQMTLSDLDTSSVLFFSSVKFSPPPLPPPSDVSPSPLSPPSENDEKQKEEDLDFESSNDIETNSVGLQKVVWRSLLASEIHAEGRPRSAQSQIELLT